MKKAFTIIIPFLREEKNIERVLCEISEKVKNPHEIRLVYDNVDDPTCIIIEKYKKARRSKNIFLVKNNIGSKRGLANAIKTGLMDINGNAVVIVMADLSDDIGQIDRMFDLIEQGNDIVCASRFMKGGKKIGGPFLKTLFARIACFTLFYMFRVPTHDATNAFKMYKKDLLKNIMIESIGGFEYSLEIVLKSHKKGYKIVEIPTIWQERKKGKSNFQLFKWLPHYLRWYIFYLTKRN